ncbi:MAG: hypothetical protein ACM3Q2_10400 [Syntrophothermus sp.]
MEDKPIENIVNDYLYSELEWVKKRINELSELNYISRSDKMREKELETLYRKEAFYIMQLAKLKGIIKPTVN